jgi:hypothetical protein
MGGQVHKVDNLMTSWYDVAIIQFQNFICIFSVQLITIIDAYPTQPPPSPPNTGFPFAAREGAFGHFLNVSLVMRNKLREFFNIHYIWCFLVCETPPGHPLKNLKNGALPMYRGEAVLPLEETISLPRSRPNISGARSTRYIFRYT